MAGKGCRPIAKIDDEIERERDEDQQREEPDPPAHLLQDLGRKD
jgi:hypothetical protein